MCHRASRLRCSWLWLRWFLPDRAILVPSRFIAWFDLGAGAGDIEYIAAALLRLGYKAKGLAAEGMSWREEIKH